MTVRAALRSLALALLAFAAPAVGDEKTAPPPVVFIIDASGSMAGRDAAAVVKLDAARGELSALLDRLPSEVDYAVVAYGHRREGDCADIETLLEPGHHDAGEAGARLAGLRARGKTPLSRSLTVAAGLLPEEGGQIVLLSDGVETCAADPCATAAALGGGTRTIAIDVIGFDLSTEEQAQLKCIADAGGGSYWSAGDSVALGVALREVGKTIVNGERVVEAPPPPPPPPPVPVILRAVAGALGEIVAVPIAWEVTGEGGATVYRGSGRAVSLDLDPGQYVVVATAANAAGALDVTVVPGRSAITFDVPVAAGALELAVAAHAGAAAFSDRDVPSIAWRLEPRDAQGPVSVPPVAAPSLLLAPGRYEITAEWNGLSATAEAAVSVGTRSAVVLDFALGVVTLEAALAGDDGALTDATRMRWDVGEAPQAHEVTGEARPRVTLPAGRHRVRLQIGEIAVATEIAVTAGEDVLRRVEVPAGTVTLSGALAAGGESLTDWRDTRWTVSAVDVPGRASGTPFGDPLYEATPTIVLPPGLWRVDLDSGISKGRAEILVEPEAERSVTVALEAGRIIGSAEAENGIEPQNVVFSLFTVDANGIAAPDAAFETGAPKAFQVIAPAGRWILRAADDRGRAGESIVEVRSGAEATVAIRLE